VKLTDLADELSYASILQALRNPEALIVRKHKELHRQSARPSLRKLILALRDNQLPIVAKLLLSPVLRPESMRSEPVSRRLKHGATEFSPREPRRVARLFVRRIIRDVRVSGLQVADARAVEKRLQPADRLFVDTLSWLVNMGDRPQKEREPLSQWLERTSVFIELRPKWTTVAGKVLGQFIDRAAYESEHPSRGSVSETAAQGLMEELSRAGDVLGESRETGRGAHVDFVWTQQFIDQGARRVMELGGSNPSIRS